MTDIYDIKGIELGGFINIIYSLIFIFFLFLLYFLYKYLEKDDILNKKENNIINKVALVPCDFNKKLDNFEKVYLKEKKEIFYSKLSEIVREILEKDKNKNISKLTFQEINKLNINIEIKDLIKNIYFKEYMQDFEDSEEIRKKLILEVRKEI